LDLLQRLQSETPRMLAVLGRLVDQESPSADIPSLNACADLVAAVFEEVLGSRPQRLERDGKPHLLWRKGAPKVLLLAHMDTVWPLGTVARWPFSADGKTATGPGSFDMKGGLVQGLFAVAALGVPDGVVFLVTSDEEVGSATSRELIESTAREVGAALVLEAALDGALKIARKGVAGYTFTVDGLAAHASQPELGVNATVAMAEVALAAAALADDGVGTTCSPTVVSAGTVANTIPARATLVIDSRAPSVAEQQRIDAGLRQIGSSVAGVKVSLEGGPNRAPMPESISRDLFERARRLAGELGLPELRGAFAPGGSDGQLTAAVGTPTLDGLGAVGGNAHAEGEFVEIAAMPQRAAVVAALVEELLALR
jgi:glutamate carboxypeptidase